MIPVRAYRGADTREKGNPPVSERASVCFVAPMAYGALSRREDLPHVGGAERQQVLLSEELVQRGYRVSFVVLDHGQPDGEEIRGIRVFKCYRADLGVRGLRFFHPRLTGLWDAMKRADADVYYQRGAEAETGLVGHWCRQHTRGFIFAVAHDANCMRVPPFAIRRSEQLLFRYGLRRASAVIAQTRHQQHMLHEAFGVTSTVIRSCSAWSLEVEEATQPWKRGLEDRVLWVGRLSEEKRPDWVIRLAAELPDCHFDIVGQCNAGSEYGRILTGRIESLPNVRWHGYVPHTKMRDLYRQARLLLCTSESEGFPNVFLEAWSCGKPVLTSVDPDGVVARFQLGHVAVAYLAMKQHLATLRVHRAMWAATGCRGREYVQEHHSTTAAGAALACMIQKVHALTPKGRSGPATSSLTR